MKRRSLPSSEGNHSNANYRQDRKIAKTESSDLSSNKAKTKEKPKTREEKRKAEEKKRPPKRIRLIPIWVRVVFFIAALLAVTIVGAMVGYGIIGEGGSPRDVLRAETWYYIYDFIFNETQFERNN